VFDIKVLAGQAAASGLPTLRHARFLDTVFLARALFPGSGAEGDPSLPPNKSLAGLYTFFAGRAPHKSHGALEDCDSNRLVLEQLLRRMPDVPGGALKAHLPAGVLAVEMHVHALVLCALP
jgi:DNA polymerase III epsilon subunit-like protein